MKSMPENTSIFENVAFDAQVSSGMKSDWGKCKQPNFLTFYVSRGHFCLQQLNCDANSALAWVASATPANRNKISMTKMRMKSSNGQLSQQ